MPLVLVRDKEHATKHDDMHQQSHNIQFKIGRGFCLHEFLVTETMPEHAHGTGSRDDGNSGHHPASAKVDPVQDHHARCDNGGNRPEEHTCHTDKDRPAIEDDTFGKDKRPGHDQHTDQSDGDSHDSEKPFGSSHSLEGIGGIHHADREQQGYIIDNINYHRKNSPQL